MSAFKNPIATVMDWIFEGEQACMDVIPIGHIGHGDVLTRSIQSW